MLSSKSINVIHLLLIGPLLVYIGINGRKCSPTCFKLLILLGSLVMIFHAYKLYEKMNGDVTFSGIGSTMSNTISNVSGQIIGQDNAGNNVVVSADGNVAVVNDNGTVISKNNATAAESANQAMNNSMKNSL